MYIGKTTRCRRPSTRCCCGWNAVERVEEVGDAETFVDPAAEVGDERVEVVGIVREERGQLDDRIDDLGDVRLRGGLVAFLGNGAVLDLQRLEGDGGRLEAEPRRMRCHGERATCVLDDLGLSDNCFRFELGYGL